MIDKVNLKGTNHYIEDNNDDGLRGTGVKVRRAYNWHGDDILCFYTNRTVVPGKFNTFGSIKLQDNYYQSMMESGSYGPLSPSVPTDWFYRVGYSGWRLEGEGVDSDGYIEVTSSQGTVGEYTCTVTKDCFLSFYPFWQIESDPDPEHPVTFWTHDEFVHPEWSRSVGNDIYFSGISKAGYETINGTSLHFTLASGPRVFGEYMRNIEGTHLTIAQGTTFQTNHSISTIKPYQIISGLTHYEVPNPVDLIGD